MRRPLAGAALVDRLLRRPFSRAAAQPRTDNLSPILPAHDGSFTNSPLASYPPKPLAQALERAREGSQSARAGRSENFTSARRRVRVTQQQLGNDAVRSLSLSCVM